MLHSPKFDPGAALNEIPCKSGFVRYDALSTRRSSANLLASLPALCLIYESSIYCTHRNADAREFLNAETHEMLRHSPLDDEAEPMSPTSRRRRRLSLIDSDSDSRVSSLATSSRLLSSLLVSCPLSPRRVSRATVSATQSQSRLRSPTRLPVNTRIQYRALIIVRIASAYPHSRRHTERD